MGENPACAKSYRRDKRAHSVAKDVAEQPKPDIDTAQH